VSAPDELFYNAPDFSGAEGADGVVHTFFRLILSIWTDKFYHEVFGSLPERENFIPITKERRDTRGREGVFVYSCGVGHPNLREEAIDVTAQENPSTDVDLCRKSG
jgi:hypothetical protein